MLLYRCLAVYPSGASQISFISPSIRRTTLQHYFGGKCFQATAPTLGCLTERQLSKRQIEITSHSCAGPFSCFSNRVWGLTWWNQYLPSLYLWSSAEVNGTKQVSACLVCLCSVESLIHHSGDVYRLEFQNYKHFPVAETILLAGFNSIKRHFLKFWLSCL